MITETAPRAAATGKRIEDLIELIDVMIDVIEEENVALAIGLPASQSRFTEQKLQLADQFECWVKEVSMHRALIHSSDRVMQEKVVERINSLRASMDENMLRLRAAIEASQRRIDAVMAAIREQISDKSTYAASGRVNGHSASCGTSFRA